jgi:hypothetical protein
MDDCHFGYKQLFLLLKKHFSGPSMRPVFFFTIFLRLKIWRNLSKILAKLVDIYSRKNKSQFIYLSKNCKFLPGKKKKTAWDKEKEIKGYNDLHSHPVCQTARKKYFLRLAFLLHNHILCMQQLNFCVFSQKVWMGWWLSRGFNGFFFVVFLPLAFAIPKIILVPLPHPFPPTPHSRSNDGK